MPKVRVTPNLTFNPIGVRLLLGEIGVGPMVQDETSITCVMSDDQIARFRNSRGAAHKLEILPDGPTTPVPPTIESVMAAGYGTEAAKAIVSQEQDKFRRGIKPYGPNEDDGSEGEPPPSDPVAPDIFPQTWSKEGHRVVAANPDAAKMAAEEGYLRVTPDPLHEPNAAGLHQVK